VAFDEALAARIRGMLADRPTVHERRMFGGIAFMDRGNMAVGISAHELMVRVGAEGMERFGGEPGAHPMRMGERTMSGMLGVSPEATETDAQLRTWIERGLAFTDTLPPKG
jgi:TfoX/Sxy family transcriptional regulator of competence genes